MINLLDRLKQANKAYREGNPIISDAEYDALLEKLPKDHEYRNEIEKEELYKGRIKHNKPMLSMQKAKTNKDMIKWIEQVKKASYNLFLNKREVFVKCTAKLDGIAGKYEQGKLITRGDGQYGNDVTNSFDKGLEVLIPDIEKTNLGEFVVKLDYFKENLSDLFSHPRNFVSGAIMSDTVNSITNKAFESDSIVFQSYDLLPKVLTNIIRLPETFRETESFISNSVNYKIDGVIFEVIDKEIKEYMGETEHHPNWAIALKPKDKTYESIVLDVRWQTGRTGKVTPVVIMKEVEIDGVMVNRATAHNAKNVVDIGLYIGAKIELIRSGSVIPYIIGVIE